MLVSVMLNMVYVVMFDKIPKGEAGRSRPWLC